MTWQLAETSRDHWSEHARLWSQIGSPLRPAVEDLAIAQRVIDDRFARRAGRGLDALVLGVTREFARLAWPRGTRLVALERNPDMIRHLWPGSTADEERIVQGDWRDPADPLGPFDVVLGDGSLSMLNYPEEYEDVCARLRSMTRAGGQWALRLYAGPAATETPEQVLDAATRGALSNINEFKLRLGMALCAARGAPRVAVADMWRAWNDWRHRHPALQRRWSPELTATIEDYRDSPSAYSFPALEPVLELLRGFATIREVCFPEYGFGDHCPTVILEP
jgi:hypothetical protein